jgi:hypothetical protein
MSGDPVKTAELEIDSRIYTLRFFESRTTRGGRRFSCEVVLNAAGDRIILDDDCITSLELKVARLAPATVYSRALAARSPVAA